MRVVVDRLSLLYSWRCPASDSCHETKSTSNVGKMVWDQNQIADGKWYDWPISFLFANPVNFINGIYQKLYEYTFEFARTGIKRTVFQYKLHEITLNLIGCLLHSQKHTALTQS